MEQKEISTKLAEIKAGVVALQAIQKGDAQIFMDPSTWPVLLEGLKVILSFFANIFGLSKAKEIEAQSKAEAEILKTLQDIAGKMSLMIAHFEASCIKKEDAQRLMTDFSDIVSSNVAASLPGAMSRISFAATMRPTPDLEDKP